MRFRKSTYDDISEIMNLVNQAKEYLKIQGINQWQDGYPNENVIRNDISNGESYVLIYEDRVVGSSTICFSGEKTYNEIFNGQWLTNDNYIVMHRVVVHNDFKGRGLFGEIICKAEEVASLNNVNSIKIDTHKENLAMQKALTKNGFIKCGIIYLENNDERIAFEKIITEKECK